MPTDVKDSKNAEKLTLDRLASQIKIGAIKNIVVLVGAGISTSAGIPDFRTPGTGLYDNLERLKLPYPEAVFDIGYFRQSPQAFFTLADELYPGKFKPTYFHRFLRLLELNKCLKRVYTQNIDTLERMAGVSPENIVEAHGSFASNRCIDCGRSISMAQFQKMVWGKPNMHKAQIPRCPDSKCKSSGGGLIKPDIVFFGENLPDRFHSLSRVDLRSKVDLVLIAGTSLTVQPFANLPDMVPNSTPRLLFNLEKVGSIGTRPKDLHIRGECDESARKLVELLGWHSQMEESQSCDENESHDRASEIHKKPIQKQAGEVLKKPIQEQAGKFQEKPIREQVDEISKRSQSISEHYEEVVSNLADQLRGSTINVSGSDASSSTEKAYDDKPSLSKDISK